MAAERVRLDDVRADLEIARVQAVDDVGPGPAQDLVAAVELGAAEVLRRQRLGLQSGAGRAVEDQHARLQRVAQRRLAGVAIDRLGGDREIGRVVGDS